MKIRVVGQDPSMNNWGLVAADVDLNNECAIEIVEMKVITNLKKNMKTNKQVRRSNLDLERARDIQNGVDQFFEAHRPKFTMVETPHGSQSALAMKGYGLCIGILSSISTPMIGLSERECKLHAFGKNTATKKQSIEWAMNKFPDAGWKMQKYKGELVSVDGYNEHIADACIALECGMFSDQFINAVKVAQTLIS